MNLVRSMVHLAPNIAWFTIMNPENTDSEPPQSQAIEDESNFSTLRDSDLYTADTHSWSNIQADFTVSQSCFSEISPDVTVSN